VTQNSGDKNIHFFSKNICKNENFGQKKLLVQKQKNDLHHKRNINHYKPTILKHITKVATRNKL
jgi:hypothetical protein